MYAFFSSLDHLSSLRTSEPFMAEFTPPIKKPQLHRVSLRMNRSRAWHEKKP